MKPSRLPIKIIALTGFVLLLVAFVAYRSGAFDKLLYKDSPSGKINSQNALIDSMIQYLSDSSHKVTSVKAYTDSIQKAETEPPLLMSGSKSGPIFKPEYHPEVDKKVDSLLIQYNALPTTK